MKTYANLRIETVRLFCTCCGVSEHFAKQFQTLANHGEIRGEVFRGVADPRRQAHDCQDSGRIVKGIGTQISAEGLAIRQGSLVGNPGMDSPIYRPENQGSISAYPPIFSQQGVYNHVQRKFSVVCALLNYHPGAYRRQWEFPLCGIRRRLAP